MENQVQEAEVIDSPKQVPATLLEAGDSNLSEKFVEGASKQIELRSKLLATALKALKPHDIQDFEGKPYIEGEGAARIMAVIRGFKVSEPKFATEHIHPHYFIECSIPMEFMGATTVAIGDCSTADVFFTGRDGKSGRYGKYLEQTGSETMASRLLLGDAKKKARENAISRGVTELLGLKGLSWEDLEKLGFSRSGAGSNISFRKGSQGGEVKTVTVSQASALGIGSVINLKGFLKEEKQGVVGDNKTITRYEITDNVKTIKVSKWGSPTPGILIGQEVFCGNVKVNEFKGEKQFTAESVELAGSEVSANDSASTK